MLGPRLRENSPRGQRPPAEKRYFTELPFRTGAAKPVFTVKTWLSEGSGSALWWQFGHRVVAGERIGVRRLEIPCQQLVGTVDRTIGDALEYCADIRIGVVAVEFGSAQEAVDRPSFTAAIVTGE